MLRFTQGAIIVLALIGSCLHGKSQTLIDTLNAKIPVAHLKSDLRTLQKILASSQPGLYLYTSEDSLNQIFNRIESSITEPLTSIEFFRRIAPLNGIIKIFIPDFGLHLPMKRLKKPYCRASPSIFIGRIIRCMC